VTEHKLLDVRHKLDDLQRLESELMQFADDSAQTLRGGHCPTLNFLRQE
jgi:MerR family mercuric resistance operon transcriptional regulator